MSVIHLEDMSGESLADVLRHEVALLERLVLRLTECNLLLGAGEYRHLPSAIDEVHEVEQELSAAEMVRAIIVDRLVEAEGRQPAEPTLTTILARLPKATGEKIDRLHASLRRLTEEAGRLRALARHLAERSVEETKERITSMERNGGVSAYERDGRVSIPSVPSARVSARS